MQMHEFANAFLAAFCVPISNALLHSYPFQVPNPRKECIILTSPFSYLPFLATVQRSMYLMEGKGTSGSYFSSGLVWRVHAHGNL